MGIRPDQDSENILAARLKDGFNASSGGQSLGGSPLQDAAQQQEKEQLAADSIEKTEILALLRDTGAEGEISADDAQGSKTRRLDIKDKIQKQRWWRLLSYLQMKQAIEAALEKVQALIEFHQSQMDTLAELIQQGRDRLAELVEQKLALLQEVDRYRKTGRFDLDENGKFKNEKARQAMAGWEEKTGERLDLQAPSSYLGVMEAVSGIEAEEAETKAGIERDERDYQSHKTKRDEAIEIKNDLESGNSERVKNALERLDKLENCQKFEATGNTLTAKSDSPSIQKENVLKQIGLKDEDLAHQGFTFDFPPLQADFNTAVFENSKELVINEPERPVIKTTVTSPSIGR